MRTASAWRNGRLRSLLLAISIASPSVAHAEQPTADQPPSAQAAASRQPASADGTERALVLPPSFGASIPTATRFEFETALLAGLRRAGLEVAPAPERLEKQGCTSSECVRAATAMADVDYAVRLTVTQTVRDYDVAIEVFDGARGTATAKAGERCELCGVVEVREMIASHAAALRQRVAAAAVSPPRLRIYTRPAGAQIRIDGAPAGSAPVTRVVTAGPHTVRAELPRHRDVERRVEAAPGVHELVTLDLPPIVGARHRTMLIAGWAAGGVGVAGLIAGVVLVGIDGRENRLVCRGDDIDASGNCRYVHETRAAGIGTLISGTLLLGASVGLLLSAARRRGGSRTAGCLQTVRARLGLRPAAPRLHL